jgi:hypothetical protein
MQRQKVPLRALNEDERTALQVIARARSERAERVARATAVLAVAEGKSFTAAARLAGRRSGDAVARLVARFHTDGLAALAPRHGGGPAVVYDATVRERMRREFQRPPDREQDGTATWSLPTAAGAAPRAGRAAPGEHVADLPPPARGGVPLARESHLVSHRHGHAQAQGWDGRPGDRSRRHPQKEGIERAYRVGEALGVQVWCQDEAGPYQAIPQPGASWQPEGQPAHQPHEYLREGTAKLLTLFRPLTGEVRAEPVTPATNAILHPWLHRELAAILATCPPGLPADTPPAARPLGRRWSDGDGHDGAHHRALSLPPVRVLLIWDNLKGHYTPDLVQWRAQRGIRLLYTPLAGSWRHMAESVQRSIVRRALAGQHPTSPQELMTWLATTVRGWNAAPTPFVWGGKRQQRRWRTRQRRHALGGSGAVTHQPVRRRAPRHSLSERLCA